MCARLVVSDRVLCARSGLVAGLHAAHGRLRSLSQVSRPHLLRGLPDVLGTRTAAQAGHCLVHPAESQVRADKGEPYWRLRQ
jgi:hypothetical protein